MTTTESVVPVHFRGDAWRTLLQNKASEMLIPPENDSDWDALAAHVELDSHDGYLSAVRSDVEDELTDAQVELVYVDYRDELTDKQVELLLDRDLVGLDDSIYEWGIECRDVSVNVILAEALHDLGHTDVSPWDLDPDGELRDLLFDLDGSDPIRDLAEHTSAPLVRQTLERYVPPISGFAPNADGRKAGHLARVLLQWFPHLGYRAAADLAHELAANGPWDWHESVRVDTLFRLDLVSMYDSLLGEQDTQRALKYADEVSVLLIDPWNGSGHEVTVPLPEPLVLPVDDAHPMYSDSGQAGYGWDEVCGLVTSAYEEAELVRLDAKGSDA